ncbi:MAG: hypothetical protein EOO39_16180 [Cytophagaceae bacterium]|nr:MAG: hypothetical protein EOO39_16180 [Cytophagaceae bacterium]
MENTITDTARSLWVIYQQMPDAVQHEFRRLLDNGDYANNEWLSLSALSLKEIWETPEEDYWDELYAKQHTAQ